MLSVDDKLAVFQKLVACATPIMFTEYDARNFEVLAGKEWSDAVLYFLFSMDSTNESWGTTDEPAFEKFRASDGYKPIVCTNPLGMLWISEIEELGGRPYRIHTLGPVFASDYSSRSIAESLSRHAITENLRRQVMDFVNSIPVVSIIRFYEYGLMLHWCLTDEQIDISDLTYINSRPHPEREVQELAKQRHGTYLAEQRMLQAVRDGNLQFDKELNHVGSAGYTEQFIAGHNLRYIKNYVIIYTALCCRAAVQGGLDVETAYTLSDQYLENIENADKLSMIHELSKAMVRDYIARVHRAKNAGSLSPRIRMACEWITLEPQSQTIHSLAEKLGYTDYYFSRLFKKETGKSVGEFILLQKIELAKQLLTTTGLSVAEITDRIGFESQSTFTARFREAMGMTPREYRNSKKAGE